MTDNVAVIREFLADWSTLDAERLGAYFTDDGVYHNMPFEPVRGRGAVTEFIKGFLATWTATDWEVLNIVGDGDIVIAERIDRTKTTAGDVDLPCVGVFELEDGKISVWRDYFDMNTYAAAMSS